MTSKQTKLPKLHTRAAFIPTTLDEASRTVELTWSTGAQVRKTDYWEEQNWIEELSMDTAHVNLDRLNNGAPLLANHSSWSLNDVIGVVEKAWIQDGEGRALVKFSERAEIAPIIADVKAGILRNISVGYNIKCLERQPDLQDGIPVYLAIDWEPMEISLVTIPADAGAQVRSEGDIHLVTITSKEDRAMPDKVKEKIPTPESKPVDETAIRAEGGKIERERQLKIRNFGKQSRTPEAEITGFIERGTSAEDARDEMFKNWSETVDAECTRSDGTTTVDERDKFIAAGVNAIRGRAGVDKMDTGNEFRGMRMTEIAKLCLEKAGVNARGLDEREMVKRAFTTSSSDFPVLLENAMHKTLQGAYATAPDTWSRFCSVGSVTDFRAHNRYRLGSFGNLDALGENSEIKNKSIPDGEKSSITATTKGNLINISRQTIINDDLGAFIGLSQMLGRAARRTIEADVYALLASNPIMFDGIALFHALHGNLTESGTVVSVAAIETLRIAMAKQMDISGNDYLDLRPALWLGGMASGGQARVTNDAQYDPDTANKLQSPNRVRGLFRDVIDSPRIAGTEWYGFADPNESPVIEVAFLNGEQEPFLDSMQGFEVDGLQWKVRLDYGVAAIDYRGAQKNTGA